MSRKPCTSCPSKCEVRLNRTHKQKGPMFRSPPVSRWDCAFPSPRLMSPDLSQARQKNRIRIERVGPAPEDGDRRLRKVREVSVIGNAGRLWTGKEG